ncbi:MAG: hypothetical protein U5N86_07435 [Planctomycetota bacterium]|nr:hypothetical protein [Planctomycetota bacterium]
MAPHSDAFAEGLAGKVEDGDVDAAEKLFSGYWFTRHALKIAEEIAFAVIEGEGGENSRKVIERAAVSIPPARSPVLHLARAKAISGEMPALSDNICRDLVRYFGSVKVGGSETTVAELAKEILSVPNEPKERIANLGGGMVEGVKLAITPRPSARRFLP